MPQISLYIDKDTLKQVEKAAEAEQVSISKWVGNQLKNTLNTNYPTNFEELFGSIQDDTFREPEDVSFTTDANREPL